MDPIQSNARMTAAVAFDIEGMGYKDPQTGRIEGFEADLARAIAQRLLGAQDRVDFIQAFDAKRIEALENGAADMVLSQLTITPERAAEVDFSIPYLITREALLVPEASSIKGLEDLAGKRIAVVDGSVSQQRMRASLPLLLGATLVVTPLSFDCLQAVANGEADAASNDLINLTALRKSCGTPDRYQIIDIGEHFTPKPFGIAVKKGRQSLVELLNQALEGLKAGGEIDRLLHENIPEIGNVTAAGELAPTLQAR